MYTIAYITNKTNRMTAKQFVKVHYPKARSEKQVTNDKKVYWLIRPALYEMYIGTGKTENKAWLNTKEIVEKYLEVTK